MKISTLSTVVACSVALPAAAFYEPIPEKGGFSGYVNPSLSGLDFSTNMVATVSSQDVSDKITNSLTASPDSQTTAMPSLNGELRYTFAGTRTQLFMGSLLDDFLTFDTSLSLGVRQDVEKLGGFSVALNSSPAITTVWEDPYVANAPRQDTDRTSTGLRLAWERILNTGAEVQITSRKIDIDRERSGQSLGLSAADQALLDRNGTVSKIEFGYQFTLSKGHLLVPSLILSQQDRDGDAMSGDGYGAMVSYLVYGERWNFVTNLSAGTWEADKANPIPAYNGVTDKSTTLGGSVTALYAQPFGLKGWNINGTVAYYQADHDIDFYDADGSMVSLGMMYRF